VCPDLGSRLPLLAAAEVSDHSALELRLQRALRRGPRRRVRLLLRRLHGRCDRSRGPRCQANVRCGARVFGQLEQVRPCARESPEAANASRLPHGVSDAHPLFKAVDWRPRFACLLFSLTEPIDNHSFVLGLPSTTGGE